MTAAEVAAVLERSDERAVYDRRLLNNWRSGYAAAELAHADDYERGYYDGVMSLKLAQHDAHRLTEIEAGRWSLRGEPRTRQSFGKPHRDDFPGDPHRPAPRPWLAGPEVHSRHACTAVCYAYKPGFYSPQDAAAILEQLPGDYADEIARLRGAR